MYFLKYWYTIMMIRYIISMECRIYNVLHSDYCSKCETYRQICSIFHNPICNAFCNFLNSSSTLSKAGVVDGTSARQAEQRKHLYIDLVCSKLGWKCVPIVVEMFGALGRQQACSPNWLQDMQLKPIPLSRQC